MAEPMWRMNGVWKRMAGVLLLCTLLCNEVTCQDDAGNVTEALTASYPATDPTAFTTIHSTIPAEGSTMFGQRAFVSSTDLPETHLNITINQSGPASGPTAGPSGQKEVSAAAGVPELEETKRIFLENRPVWCKEQGCDLKLHQDGNILHVGSNKVDVPTLTNMLLSEPLQGKLTSSPSSPSSSSSSNSSVFVGVLVSGLLAAAAITAGYCKCQRRSKPKGVKLAEEAYSVDQENQGNTLVSVAPLNPPPETPEKPSVNGESPEAVKTESTPPTNGHSTPNTADTEM